MCNEPRKILSKARLDKARECIADARRLYTKESFNGAVNRSYFSVFHAMRSVLALDGFDSKRYSSITSEFQRLYVKTGLLPKEFSNIIESAFNTQARSDYDDFYIISNCEVKQQIDNAGTFLAMIEKYLSEVS